MAYKLVPGSTSNVKTTEDVRKTHEKRYYRVCAANIGGHHNPPLKWKNAACSRAESDRAHTATNIKSEGPTQPPTTPVYVYREKRNDPPRSTWMKGEGRKHTNQQ